MDIIKLSLKEFKEEISAIVKYDITKFRGNRQYKRITRGAGARRWDKAVKKATDRFFRVYADDRLLKKYRKKELLNLKMRLWRPVSINDPSLGLAGEKGKKIPTWQGELAKEFFNVKGELHLEKAKLKFIYLNKARQIGATMWMAQFLVMVGILAKKPIRITMGMSTGTWFEQTMVPYIRDFLPVIPRGEIRGYFKMTKKEVIIGNLLIQIMAVDTVASKDRDRGKSPDGVLMDECAYINNPDAITKSIISPLIVRSGFMIMGSTPRVTAHWFRDYFDPKKIKQLQQLAGDLIIKPIEVNVLESELFNTHDATRIAYRFYTATIMHKKPTDQVTHRAILELTAQEYYNYFFAQEEVSKELIPQFKKNEKTIVYSEDPNYNDKNVFRQIVSIDYGISISNKMAVLFLVIDNFGRVFVFDEILIPDASIGQTAKLILKKVEGWGLEPEYMIDPNIVTSRDKTDDGVEILKLDRFRSNGIDAVRPERWKFNKKEEFINSAFSLDSELFNPFREEMGGQIIYIHSRCWQLIKQLREVKIISTRGVRKNNSSLTNNDLIDALMQMSPVISAGLDVELLKRGREIQKTPKELSHTYRYIEGLPFTKDGILVIGIKD